MEWTAEQAASLVAIDEWIKNPKSPQVFRLFGYAGTGKTTLAKHIADNVDGDVLFAAFTGKAAMVMRNKGCRSASTIHSLIYKPVENKTTGVVDFSLNYDSLLGNKDTKLLILDEVSMVNEEMAQDLLYFNKKILVLGDPGQLPPVSGFGYFTQQEPDFMLTEIRRQATENPIVYLSMLARNGDIIRPGVYGDSIVIHRGDLSEDQKSEIMVNSDQVLCGLNTSRQRYNTMMRSTLNRVGQKESFHPVVGDKLISLRNNREKRIYNGGLWEITGIGKVRQKGLFSAITFDVSSLDNDNKQRVNVSDLYFQGLENTLDWKVKKMYDEFVYGYAITVHKSQGSQFGNVTIYDESYAFNDQRRNHLYTAITRAEDRIVLIQ